MSAALNSAIEYADAHGSEIMAENESGVPITQILLEVESVCGSDAAGFAASVAGLSFPSSDGAICSGSRAGALIGAISWVWSDDRERLIAVAGSGNHGLESVGDQVSADIGHKIQVFNSNLMARGVAIDLL